MNRYLRCARYTALWLVYASGIRSYCPQCDQLRWAWTHRRCTQPRKEA